MGIFGECRADHVRVAQRGMADQNTAGTQNDGPWTPGFRDRPRYLLPTGLSQRNDGSPADEHLCPQKDRQTLPVAISMQCARVPCKELATLQCQDRTQTRLGGREQGDARLQRLPKTGIRAGRKTTIRSPICRTSLIGCVMKTAVTAGRLRDSSFRMRDI